MQKGPKLSQLKTGLIQATVCRVQIGKETTKKKGTNAWHESVQSMLLFFGPGN